MSLQVLLNVTNHAQVDGNPFLLDAAMLLGSPEHPFALNGDITLSEQLEIESVKVTANELGLNDEDAREIIEAACRSSWNAVVVNGQVSAGMHWQAFAVWLAGYAPCGPAERIPGRVFRAFKNRHPAG